MFHGNFEKTKEFNKCSKRQEWKSQVKKDKNGRVTNKKIQVMLLKEDNIILILYVLEKKIPKSFVWPHLVLHKAIATFF
jgi:hypothetical protein